MSAARRPLVILGLDVGDPDAIEGWVNEGWLPTIGRLMERGAWGRTGGPEMICEYGVGLTMFSGVSRRDHGYYYFRQLVPGSYDLTSVRPPVVKAPPFWGHLGPSGERVLVVDVPDIRPVRGLHGVQLANWVTHHGAQYPSEAEPPEILQQVPRRPFPKQIRLHSAQSTFDEDCSMGDMLLKRTRYQGSLFRELLLRGPFDLISLFFSETHAATHVLWKYRPEGSGGYADTHPLRHGIRDSYAAVDEEMGRLIRTLSAEANVFVVSQYGMQDEHPTSTLIESFLEKLGYHVRRSSTGSTGGGPQPLNPLHLARRFLPEGLRRAISRRLPATHQERLLASRLRDATDWGRTTAFAVPSLFTSFVRVNLRDREPHGIVMPGDEYQSLLARLEADLGLLVDAETGSRAVRRVARATTLFGGGPPDSLPDLFVEWEPGSRMLHTVRHPAATLAQETPDFHVDSQEKLTGFVAAAGPDIARAGAIGEIDLLDLAPTFMMLLGHPSPETMRGRTLSSLLA